MGGRPCRPSSTTNGAVIAKSDAIATYPTMTWLELPEEECACDGDYLLEDNVYELGEPQGVAWKATICVVRPRVAEP